MCLVSVDDTGMIFRRFIFVMDFILFSTCITEEEKYLTIIMGVHFSWQWYYAPIVNIPRITIWDFLLAIPYTIWSEIYVLVCFNPALPIQTQIEKEK